MSFYTDINMDFTHFLNQSFFNYNYAIIVILPYYQLINADYIIRHLQKYIHIHLCPIHG